MSTLSTVSSVLPAIKLAHPGVKSHTLISKDVSLISPIAKTSGITKKTQAVRNIIKYVRRDFIAKNRGEIAL